MKRIPNPGIYILTAIWALFVIILLAINVNAAETYTLPNKFNASIKCLAVQSDTNIASTSSTDNKIQHLIFTDTVPVSYTDTCSLDTDTYKHNSTGDITAYWDNNTKTMYIYAKGQIQARAASDHLFFKLTALRDISFDNFDTSAVVDMHNMFRDCSSLTSVDISSFNTFNVNNMNAMFYGCKNLKSADLSGIDTSNVTDMAFMFYQCKVLQSLDLNHFNTSKVHTMRYMFAECYGLESLIIDDFDTTSVTTMTYMFQGCQSLTYLDVSGFNTSKVNDMEYMFTNCRLLETIDVSGFDTSNVQYLDYMFAGCASVKELDVSKFDTSSAVNLAYMFAECTQITSLDLSNFDTAACEDMCYMFAECNSLENIDCSSFDTSGVTDMTCMFNNCTSAITIDTSSFNTINVIDYPAMFLGCESLEEVNMSGFDMAEAGTVDDMFEGCESLRRIITPISVPEDIILPTNFYDKRGNSYTDLPVTSTTDEIRNIPWGNTYIISFNSNGGKGIMKSIDAECGADVQLPLNTFTNGEFVFHGWSTEKNPEKPSFKDGATVRDLAEMGGKVVLYAIWGLPGSEVEIDINVPSSYKVILPAIISLKKNTLPDTPNNDYVCGYTVSVSGNIAADEFINVLPDTEDHRFILKDRSEKRSADPAVYANGVTWTPEQLEGGDTVSKGAIIEAFINKAGKYSGNLVYNFRLEKERAENTHPNMSKSHTGVTDDGTLYIMNGNENTRTIIFDANGGTTPITTKNLNTGDKIGELPVPEFENHTFLGWFTKESGGKQITENYVVEDNMKIYAQWLKIYTVNFDATQGITDVKTLKAAEGEIIKDLPEPTRKNYEFAGWFIDSAGGEQFTSGTPIHSDLNLHAHWNVAINEIKLTVAGNDSAGWVDHVAAEQPDGTMKTYTDLSNIKTWEGCNVDVYTKTAQTRAYYTITDRVRFVCQPNDSKTFNIIRFTPASGSEGEAVLQIEQPYVTDKYGTGVSMLLKTSTGFMQDAQFKLLSDGTEVPYKAELSHTKLSLNVKDCQAGSWILKMRIQQPDGSIRTYANFNKLDEANIPCWSNCYIDIISDKDYPVFNYIKNDGKTYMKTGSNGSISGISITPDSSATGTAEITLKPLKTVSKGTGPCVDLRGLSDWIKTLKVIGLTVKRDEVQTSTVTISAGGVFTQVTVNGQTVGDDWTGTVKQGDIIEVTGDLGSCEWFYSDSDNSFGKGTSARCVVPSVSGSGTLDFIYGINADHVYKYLVDRNGVCSSWQFTAK